MSPHPHLPTPTRRALLLARVLLALVVASASFAQTLTVPRAHASGNQTLQWNDAGDTFVTLGPDAMVSIQLGVATAGTCDGFIPATDLYVVSTPTLADKADLKDVSNAQGLPNTAQLASGGRVHFVDLSEAGELPAGAREYVLEGERQGLHTRFKCRIRAPWYAHCCNSRAEDEQ